MLDKANKLFMLYIILFHRKIFFYFTPYFLVVFTATNIIFYIYIITKLNTPVHPTVLDKFNAQYINVIVLAKRYLPIRGKVPLSAVTVGRSVTAGV